MQAANRLFTGMYSFKIPPYQREYQWTSGRWQNFWTDLGLLLNSTHEEPTHFLGLILFDRSSISGVGDAEELLVIDGQQRLVTLMLARAAARDHWIEKNHQPRPSPDPIWNLVDEDRVVPRLTPQEADKEDLEIVITGQWREWYRQATSKKKLQSSRILNAYVFFRLCLWLGTSSFTMQDLDVPPYRRGQDSWSAEDVWSWHKLEESPVGQFVTYEDIALAIKRLQFLQVSLDHNDEDAATVFDSLNAHQSPLEQWDFVRNSLFIRLPPRDAQAVFDQAWNTIQSKLKAVTWENKRAESRDAFLYDYLISVGESRYQGSINQSRTANQLRNRLGRLTNPPDSLSIRQFVEEDLLFSARHWPVAVGYQNSPIGVNTRYSDTILEAINTCTQISSGPPFPVILNILIALGRKQISESEATGELRALESLLIRMVLVGRPFSPLRALTQQLLEKVNSGSSRISLDLVLQNEARSGSLIPTDKDVHEAVKSNSYYLSKASGRQLAAIFRGIERQLSGSASHTLPYGRGDTEWTVEHILPQSALTNRAPAWQSNVPSSPARRQALLDQVHNLGNLTLLTNGANSYLKNRGFSDKKLVFGGYDPNCRMPHLAINDSVLNQSKWSSRAISARGSLLGKLITDRWSII